MIKGFMAKKVGMSQKFLENGDHVPVTLLEVEDHVVINKGIGRVRLGTDVTKEMRINKPQRNYLKKYSLPMVRKVKEFACDDVEAYEIGQTVTVDALSAFEYVDVTAYTKGRGFTGVMKRWNFAGLCASHGVSVSHRSHGSTGNRQDPGRVFKGKKMAGHYGAAQRTVQNLKVVEIIPDSKLILVRGAVPGPKGGLVLIKKAVKKGGRS